MKVPSGFISHMAGWKIPRISITKVFVGDISIVNGVYRYLFIGNQTWLAGKSNVNGAFNGKIINGGCSIAMFDYHWVFPNKHPNFISTRADNPLNIQSIHDIH